MPEAHEPLQLARGPQWRNRLALSAMTTCQSNLDGTLTDDEIGWLVPRAQAGFGMLMTAAAFVSPEGNAWPGQLGVCDEKHLPGMTRLADALREAGAVSCVQLHHGGNRAEASAERVSALASKDARALTTDEIGRVVDDFASGAARVERAGFDGAEIHAAHGYLINQFLEPGNQRTDGYGGDLEGRSRILHEIIDAVRAATSASFQVGIRLSAIPEEEQDFLILVERFVRDARLDYVDASVWDYRRLPRDAGPGERTLTEIVGCLPRDGVALGITGKLRSAADVRCVMGWGADFVGIGRAAIVDHRFAQRCLGEVGYVAPQFPVTRQQLREEHLGEAFVAYFSAGWPDLVSP